MNDAEFQAEERRGAFGRMRLIGAVGLIYAASLWLIWRAFGG